MIQVPFGSRLVDFDPTSLEHWDALNVSPSKPFLVQFIHSVAESVSNDLRLALEMNDFNKAKKLSGELDFAESLILLLTEGIKEVQSENSPAL